MRRSVRAVQLATVGHCPSSRKRGGGVRVFCEIPGRRGDQQGDVPVDLETLPRQPGGRHHQVAPGHRTVAGVRLAEAVDQAWHRDGRGAPHIAVVGHGLPGKEVAAALFTGQREIGGIEAGRSAHAIEQRLGPLLGGMPQHGCAAAGRPAHPRLDHADGEGDGDGRIDGVATGLQHLGADLCRPPVLSGDDAFAGTGCCLAGGLGSGEG